jgi:hypothetical protein
MNRHGPLRLTGLNALAAFPVSRNEQGGDIAWYISAHVGYGETCKLALPRPREQADQREPKGRNAASAYWPLALREHWCSKQQLKLCSGEWLAVGIIFLQSHA